MRKRVFLQNAAIMTITALLLRAIGMVFRVYISQRIGAQGMGLYQLILSVYVLFSSFASSGLTTAVTRLCTDALANRQPLRARRILRTSIVLGCTVGILSAVLVCGGAKWIATAWIHDARAELPLYALSISLPFMGISCCIKGYFLAKRKVSASSFSQILEQVVRIGCIWFLLQWDVFRGVTMSCLAVMLGDTVAEAVSCGYIVLVHLCSVGQTAEDAPNSDPVGGTVKPLVAIAAPITAGRYINSGLRTIENTAVPLNLTYFCGSREAALADFGKLKGMALPLIFFPSSFLNAFSALLIPEVSESKALGHNRQVKRTVEKSISLTLLSAYLIGGIFWVIAEPLCELIYNDASIGMYIRFLAPLTPVMYVESVAVGLLKGLNQQTPSLIYGIMDSVARILMIYTLLPTFGMSGMMGLMVFSNLLTCGLHMHRLTKVSGCRFLWRKWIWKPLAAVIPSISFTEVILHSAHAAAWDQISVCMVCALLICIVYIALLVLFKGVSADDLTMIKRFKPQMSIKKEGSV